MNMKMLILSLRFQRVLTLKFNQRWSFFRKNIKTVEILKMAKKTKTIEWHQGRIIEILSTISEDPTDSILYSKSTRKNNDETNQHYFDVALCNLICDGIVIQNVNDRGNKIYKLTA